jgi:hypothetical protein
MQNPDMQGVSAAQFYANANQTFIINKDNVQIQYPNFTTKHNSVKINEQDPQAYISRGNNTPSRNQNEFIPIQNMTDFEKSQHQGTVETNKIQIKSRIVSKEAINSSLKTQASQNINNATQNIN